jgi:hypothetical protein
MSADNFLYVRRTPDHKWTVTMEMGEEVQPVRDTDPRYSLKSLALLAASEWLQSGEIIEYGIQVEADSRVKRCTCPDCGAEHEVKGD